MAQANIEGSEGRFVQGQRKGSEEAFGSPVESRSSSETMTRARMLITSTNSGICATPPGSCDAPDEGHLAERKAQAPIRWVR